MGFMPTTMKFLRYTFFTCFTLLYGAAQAQNLKQFGLIHHSIEDIKLGTINFYITDSLHLLKKPLLLYLDGSGDNPLFTYQADKSGNFKKYTSIPFDYRSASTKYHIVFISKPNIVLADTLRNKDLSITNFKYNQLLSAEWRVNSALKVLAFIQNTYPVDSKKIVVCGYSEGAQVAPIVAARNKNITHCIAFVGGGLNQFFNQIIEYRMAAKKNEINEQEAQNRIDSLYSEFEKIYNNPSSTSDFWFGHTYLRWSSFCAVPTIEYFTKLSIPIYIAQGTDDESTSILSSDYIKMEFLRLRKQNLTQKIYPDCDHMFNRKLTENGKTEYDNILDKVMEDAFKWLAEQK